MPNPPNFGKYYFLSEEAMNLNYLTKEILLKLPPTDSWLRPDLRAYEFGDIENASKEKSRLE